MVTTPAGGSAAAVPGPADQGSDNQTTQVIVTDYVPATTKIRKFFGVHTDRDVEEASNLVMRTGASLVVAAINPVAGAAALAYTVGATIRDDQNGKRIAAMQQAQAENPSA